ncbi:MAG: DUF5317 family protein [Ilumatobacteraceae bacterium]
MERSALFVIVVLIGLIAGWVRPRCGRYGQPRAVGVVFVAAVAQVVALRLSGVAHAAFVAIGVAMGAAWIALQRRHVASVMLGLGAGLNVVVIAANGGMPVDPGALARVGRANVDVAKGFLYKHVPMTTDTRWSWLADRIPVPLQRNVISVGDVVMALAICLWVADSVGSARWRRSAGSVDCEHGRRPGGEIIRDDE